MPAWKVARKRRLPGSQCRYHENSLMQVSPIFDSMWKTMRRCLNGPVGFAFAAALLVVITYQFVSLKGSCGLVVQPDELT